MFKKSTKMLKTVKILNTKIPFTFWVLTVYFTYSLCKIRVVIYESCTIHPLSMYHHHFPIFSVLCTVILTSVSLFQQCLNMEKVCVWLKRLRLNIFSAEFGESQLTWVSMEDDLSYFYLLIWGNFSIPIYILHYIRI